MCDYDEAGSIGKRYRREDEIGTPYCVTVDFDTLEDNQVTVRDRDTMEQVRMPIDEIENWIKEKINFQINKKGYKKPNILYPFIFSNSFN